jgi:hypothetical protein
MTMSDSPYVRVQCPQCRKTMRAREGSAGKRVRCPACANSVVVPGSHPAPPADGPEAVAVSEPQVRRRRWPWLVAGAAAGLLLAGLGVWVIRGAWKGSLPTRTASGIPEISSLKILSADPQPRVECSFDVVLGKDPFTEAAEGRRGKGMVWVGIGDPGGVLQGVQGLGKTGLIRCFNIEGCALAQPESIHRKGHLWTVAVTFPTTILKEHRQVPVSVLLIDDGGNLSNQVTVLSDF